MAEEAESLPSSLSDQYDRCMKLYTAVKESTASSSDPDSQTAVQAAIAALEELTRAVSAADLFSGNEAADELPTSSLRFLLVPQLLGDLTCRRAHTDRMQVISIAEVYYRDFLQRCRDYSITETDIPRDRADEPEQAARQPRAPTMRDLATMSKQREERLRRYREQKELERQLTELQEALKRPGADEDTTRRYYLTLLRQAVGNAVAELNSLQLEKPILEHMQQLKARGGAVARPELEEPPPARLRPVVITRTKMEAKVFGPGYSSLPTMSVEEFYEQRVRDGTFPPPAAAAASSAAAPTGGGGAADGDARGKERDLAEDTHDDGAVAKARAFDDYKDDHKRGEGNRYNRS